MLFMTHLKSVQGDVPFTDDEIEQGKQSIIQSLPARFSSVNGIGTAVGTIYTQDLPEGYYRELADHINAVTRDDLVRVAKKYIDMDHLNIVIVGDRATIEGPIKATGIAPIQILDVEGNPAPLSNTPTSGRATPPVRPVHMTQRLAEQIPDYGGAFIDKDGAINVYLTDLSAAVAARPIVQQELRMVGHPERPIKFVKGDYRYQFLDSLAKPLMHEFGHGVSGWGVDDRNNRLVIFVVTDEDRERIVKAIAKAKLPLSAIIIKKAPYAVAL
jgi:hypothetical protein